MQKLLTYFMLLCATLLLTGFSWGFGSSDPCRNALELAGSLEGLRDEVQVRQTEARILSLCPDGGAGHFVSGLQLERVGNLDGAISEYRKALQQEKTFPLASGNLGLLYAQKGMNDEASVELARGLASHPSPRYHKAMARILAVDPAAAALPPVPDLPTANVRAFSIDDATTTEIDDAFSVRELPNGHYEVGIHIAAPALGIARGAAPAAAGPGGGRGRRAFGVVAAAGAAHEAAAVRQLAAVRLLGRAFVRGSHPRP